MGVAGRVDAAVDEKEVVEVRVEGVTPRPCRMVDQQAVAAQFRDEDLVAQGLRGGQVVMAASRTS